MGRINFYRDVNKDLTPMDQDKDRDLTPKDKDLTPKDKDLTPKDQDKDHGYRQIILIAHFNLSNVQW